jgi:predicted ATPase/DNA-binding SARP family transcriptional activator/tetratricopeptide (TPR) repeat protein
VTTELILLSRVAYRDREISGPRLRGLLALLARDLRSGCSTARLVDGLWPDEQPENPTKALHVLVSRARAQLGSDVIVRTPAGYRLSVRDDQVDTAAVLLSESASRQHSRAGDHAAALADAEAGLALWDGAPGGEIGLGDSGFGDPLSELRAERASTYRSLVRARALALSRLGRHAEAVEALTGVARERPRDEEVLLELLHGEAATVGPAAALARYEAYRRWLRDELGTDPGDALQAVHQQLLQGAVPAVRHGVQHEPNPLLGRDDDLAAVASLLRTSRVASIVGPGGLGKTRLAHAVSRQAEQRIVHFVALAGVAGDGDVVGDVVGEVASVLGVGESRRTSVGHPAIPTDVLTGIVDTLGPGPALLVLDNCEHVVRGVAELVRDLVSMTRDLRVLTTSRAPLGLSSESVYLLPELDLRTTVELFGQRARAARPGVDLPAGVVTELCRHLDGLPLAVELAAARVRVMTVGEIARRLADRFSLLRGGPRDAPERHHTLQAVVDWSWNLLDPAGQAAMRALSIVPGGFTADAAQQLLDDDALRLVEHLVDQSLLKVVDTALGARFRMLETVREFSTAEREAAGETDRVVDRFLSWARDFGVAHHESPFGADPASTLDLIRAEQDNLLQALRYGLAGVDGATVAATAAVLAALWTVDSNYTRMAALGGETGWVLSHYRPTPEFVEVTRTAAALCTAYEFTIHGPRAMRSLVVLRRLPPAPPDTLTRAVAAVLRIAPEMDTSVLTELCNSGEPLLAGVASGVASYLWENGGDTDGALKAAERMLEVFEHRESPLMRILASSRLAELHMHLDEGAEALRHLRAAWLDQDKLGNWPDAVGLRWAMVLACLQVGALDEAEHWMELVGVDLAEDMFAYRTFEVAVRGELLLARGEVDAGLAQWRRAVELLASDRIPGVRVEPGLEPWSLEIKAVAVVAHARHGRLDRVAETVGELPPALSALLTDPGQDQPSFRTGLPLCGALLLALAMADLDRGERTGDERATRSGPRLIALAERFRCLRQFQPTMSAARARQAAERADRSAYDDAVSSYADLGPDALRAAALVALRERA